MSEEKMSAEYAEGCLSMVGFCVLLYYLGRIAEALKNPWIGFPVGILVIFALAAWIAWVIVDSRSGEVTEQGTTDDTQERNAHESKPDK